MTAVLFENAKNVHFNLIKQYRKFKMESWNGIDVDKNGNTKTKRIRLKHWNELNREVFDLYNDTCDILLAITGTKC